MDGDKMLLSWNNFETTAPNTFRKSWTDQDFADVTLATEDDKQIRAHKVILSSCSQFFRKILLQNPHQNPLIYMKGMKHAELEMGLKFINIGECHVPNERLQEVIYTGFDLKMEGLMKNAGIKNQDDVKTKEERMANPDISHNLVNRSDDDQHQAKPKYVRFKCDQCEYKATRPGNLRKHQKSIHECMIYNCDQCDIKYTDQSHLRRHQKSKHEGVHYNCKQCDYKAKRPGSTQTVPTRRC